MLNLMGRLARMSWDHIRRVVIMVIGGIVLLLGIVMIVTPGPAFLIIPAGLAILATEFGWARNLLKNIKARASHMAESITKRRKTSAPAPSDPPSPNPPPSAGQPQG